MKTIIQVEAFGDFDKMYTLCIMISEEKFDIKELNAEFCQVEGIADINGLPYNRLFETTENYVAFLELKGFKALDTQVVYFSE